MNLARIPRSLKRNAACPIRASRVYKVSLQIRFPQII